MSVSLCVLFRFELEVEDKALSVYQHVTLKVQSVYHTFDDPLD